MHITKEDIIGDILNEEPEAAALFIKAGMHCITCPSARGETVEQACAVHGIDADAFTARFNAQFSEK